MKNNIRHCDRCTNELGYRSEMHWPPYKATCSKGIKPTKLTMVGRLVKYNCVKFKEKE